MNAITAIKAEPAWAKYLPAVETFVPGASPREAADRARIMLIRDRALNAANKCSWEAMHAFEAAAQVAAHHAFTPMTAAQLDATHIALLRLYLAARQIDLVFSGPNDG